MNPHWTLVLLELNIAVFKSPDAEEFKIIQFWRKFVGKRKLYEQK